MLDGKLGNPVVTGAPAESPGAVVVVAAPAASRWSAKPDWLAEGVLVHAASARPAARKANKNRRATGPECTAAAPHEAVQWSRHAIESVEQPLQFVDFFYLARGPGLRVAEHERVLGPLRGVVHHVDAALVVRHHQVDEQLVGFGTG